MASEFAEPAIVLDPNVRLSASTVCITTASQQNKPMTGDHDRHDDHDDHGALGAHDDMIVISYQRSMKLRSISFDFDRLMIGDDDHGDISDIVVSS